MFFVMFGKLPCKSQPSGTQAQTPLLCGELQRRLEISQAAVSIHKGCIERKGWENDASLVELFVVHG